MSWEFRRWILHDFTIFYQHIFSPGTGSISLFVWWLETMCQGTFALDQAPLQLSWTMVQWFPGASWAGNQSF